MSYVRTIVSCCCILAHFSEKGKQLQDQPLRVEVYALRDINIRVPEAVRLGDTVTLACDYDLEKVALYTIKWYRYDEEFYRYVPKESPPSKVFIMPHINVDLPHSNSKEVTLTHVDRETSGEYKCEVSADAPLFHTEIRAANLLVADVPTHDVLLVNETQKVAPGGKVKVNCTTPSSFPAMNVTWHINDVQVHPRTDVHIDNVVRQYESLPGLDAVTSTLSLRAQQDFFHLGKMRVRCTGTLFALYNSSQEIEVQEDAPSMALVILPTRSNNDGINQGFRLSSSSNPLSSISSLATWLTWFIAKAIYH